LIFGESPLALLPRPPTSHAGRPDAGARDVVLAYRAGDDVAIVGKNAQVSGQRGLWLVYSERTPGCNDSPAGLQPTDRTVPNSTTTRPKSLSRNRIRAPKSHLARGDSSLEVSPIAFPHRSFGRHPCKGVPDLWPPPSGSDVEPLAGPRRSPRISENEFRRAISPPEQQRLDRSRNR
jgi:hypothetical protein